MAGPLGRLDAQLANLTRHVCPTCVLGRFRRLVYLVGPSVDGLAYRPQPRRRVVKVSSHYRAWARAQAQGDTWLDRAFTASRRTHVRFAGATLLSTNFEVRLARHRADVAAGRTSKVEQRRFFGPDQARFDAWHTALDRLLDRYVGRVQRLDTSTGDCQRLAEQVAMRVLSCWAVEEIQCPL